MANLYTILFSNGLIKVGMTKRDPKSRIASHTSSLGIANVTVSDYDFIECPSDDVSGAERLLINHCKAQPGVTQKSKEWFYGLDFANVSGAMRDIAKNITASSDSCKTYPAPENAESKKIFRKRAINVVRCAATMSTLDDDVVEIILNGMDRDRYSMIITCWDFVSNKSVDGIISNNDVNDLIEIISRQLMSDFMCKIL